MLYNEDFSVFASVSDSPVVAENSVEPTVRDLLTLLQNVSGRLEAMERKIGVIENIEKRMGAMEKDMNNLWVAIENKVKKSGRARDAHQGQDRWC
ncbi:hypothetical protein DPMN_007037 [Dreissena polymorpha]|uniref:Uncharacterized protein n=1 Tax=Dreissena polymorpha TaxID=45954 RepID=A0A9D4MSJ4_DREPO|nr:hypothetical protein DPMN_007037 [Dreissena polymorpha]